MIGKQEQSNSASVESPLTLHHPRYHCYQEELLLLLLGEREHESEEALESVLAIESREKRTWS